MSDGKPLKKYRSEAERIAMEQRNLQIKLVMCQITLTALVVLLDILIALKAFGIL